MRQRRLAALGQCDGAVQAGVMRAACSPRRPASTMPGTSATPSPASTKLSTASISPPSTAKRRLEPGLPARLAGWRRAGRSRAGTSPAAGRAGRSTRNRRRVDAGQRLDRGDHQALAQQRLGAQRRVGAGARSGRTISARSSVAAARSRTRSCEPPSSTCRSMPGCASRNRRSTGGHERGAEARGGAEPDPAAAQADQLLHLPPGGVDVGEDPRGQRQQRLAGRGERDVARAPRSNSGAPRSASRA